MDITEGSHFSYGGAVPGFGTALLLIYPDSEMGNHIYYNNIC